MFFYEEEVVLESKDSIDTLIENYTKIIGETSYTDPLVFWKKYEFILPELAKLAKKYLSIQASSAAVERMFSISGHIFCHKRRRLSVRYFYLLVFLIKVVYYISQINYLKRYNKLVSI